MSTAPITTDALKTTLWEHQREAVRFALDTPGSLQAICMGGGKSAVALAVALETNARRILITCPLSVVGVWPHEIERHVDEVWAVARLDRGSVARKRAEAERVLSLADHQRACVIINHESTWREPFRTLAFRTHWDLLVVDESHRAKAPGGKFSRFLGRLGRQVPRRLGLTGTPLPHSPLDVYGQGRFLAPGIYGNSFTRFRSRYAVMGGYEQHQVIGWQNMAEYEYKFDLLSFQVRKEDALDLPPEVDEERRCQLEPAAEKIYRQLETNFYAAVEAGEITASNALVKLLRLQQCTSGTLKTDDGTLAEVSTAKRKLLADVLDDIPVTEPVVIFCRFTADLVVARQVAQAGGRRVGEVSGHSKDGITDAARMRPDVDVLVVQIQAGGVGIDLSRAAVAIYYSHGWSLGDLLQSRARLHRPGQTRSVTYIHLIADGTVDWAAVKALRAREEMIDWVLKGLDKGA